VGLTPNLTAVRENILPLMTGAVAVAGNRSAVGDPLAWAADRVKGIAVAKMAARNWTAAERERLDQLTSQANNSYTDLLASTAQQVENVAWWLGATELFHPRPPFFTFSRPITNVNTPWVEFIPPVCES